MRPALLASIKRIASTTYGVAHWPFASTLIAHRSGKRPKGVNVTAEQEMELRQIGRDRFDAFVGFCRTPEVTQIALELAWFETPALDVFAALVVDTDREFSAIVFTEDLNGRFRWSNQTGFHDNPETALDELLVVVDATLSQIDTMRVQGNETRRSVDFFTPIVPEGRLHPTFERVRHDPAHQASRELIAVMMRWYQDRDGNFVQQFQSDGFDARIWELYLWAMLVSLGYQVRFPRPAPDMLARFLADAFALEATTVNPSVINGQVTTVPVPDGVERASYFRNYLPIRFAGPLLAKLQKRDWEHPEVADLPFLLAVQDFHSDLSMTYSGGALPSYLYGLDLVTAAMRGGNTQPMLEHRWGTKVVPSGFFALEGAEHISAVMFNASGTLSKFNRLGLKLGFAADSDVRVVHRGVRAVVDDQEVEYEAKVQVVAVDYPEDWVDGLEVYHNPRAVNPLDPDQLPGAAHHFFESGRLLSMIPDGHLERGDTVIISPVSEERS